MKMTSMFTNGHCTWCACCLKRGDTIYRIKPDKFNEYIWQLISRACGVKNVHAIGIKKNIISFLKQKPAIIHNVLRIRWSFMVRCKDYCLDCGEFDIKFSNSGRTIRQPRRLQDEVYVTGSGEFGCDHYDHGYDNGHFHGCQNKVQPTGNLKGFVVDDDEFDEEIENSSSGEEEWESSSEEEYDSDMYYDMYYD